MPSYPPFIPVISGIRARISASYVPTIATAMNLLSFRANHVGPVTGGDVAAVMDAVDHFIADKYRHVFTASWRITKIEVFAADDLVGPFAATAVDYQGTLLDEGDRPEHAPLILLNTGLRGRNYHGRVYTFAPDAAGVKPDNSGYTTVHLNSLVDAFNTLIGYSEAAAVPFAVISETIAQATPVTGITYSPRLTLQKRRRPGFGS